MSREATGRATLAPVERTKGGKTYWQARGQIPVREGDGSVGSRRKERGFGPDCKTAGDRARQCAAWNAEYEERFRNPKRVITFARAYTNYLSKDYPLPYYGEEILEALGELSCADIDDTMMAELTANLWPDGAAPATVNRYLYTPVLAILHMALKEKAPQLARPKGHNAVTQVLIPPMIWYKQLWPHLNPTQRAFVGFMAAHGRRTSEALARQPRDLDPAKGMLDLVKTKTGVRVLELHPLSLELILSMPGWDRREWLFGCGPNSANSFRRDLMKACKRAGVRWYHPHAFGRHFSVTSMLQKGYSVAHVADAHGMTADMVTRRYGHLAKKETTAALHSVGGDFLNAINGGNEGERTKVVTIEHDANLLESLRNRVASNAHEMPPSEGDALSICATGALDNQGAVADETGLSKPERTENNGGRTGES
jgi:integrase